jgi:two-component system NarL family sensor kinase
MDPMSASAHKSSPRRRRSPRPTAAHLARLLRQQESLRSIVESISSELELQPLLDRILHHACEIIGADTGTIGLVDPARDLVRTAATYCMPSTEAGAEMPRGVGLAGEVLRTGEPVIRQRYADLPHTARPAFPDNAVVGVPIRWHGAMIGVVSVGTAPRAERPGEQPRTRPLGDDDVEALTLFARHAAIAIVNARRYEEERQRSERLALVARVAHLVTADLQLDDLLRSAADAIHEILGFPNVGIALIDPDDPRTLVIRTLGGHFKTLIEGEHRIPITAGLMGAAVRGREVVLVNDVANDPRYITPPGSDGIRAELAIPILTGERVMGVLNVESTGPLSDADAAILVVIADQLAVAIENARLYATAQQVAVLEERQRLARELHDAVTQHLAGVALMAQTLSSTYGRDAGEGDRRARRLVEVSQAALVEMRALMDELRPARTRRDGGTPNATASAPPSNPAAEPWLARVRRHGLAHALGRLAEDTTRDGTSVEVEVGAYAPQPAACEEALFRIAQEALANAVKHARANHVSLRLDTRDGSTVLAISDDGVGLGASTLPVWPVGVSGGLGLATMRERAAAIGAALRIDSAKGSGTSIEVIVPLGEECPA